MSHMVIYILDIGIFDIANYQLLVRQKFALSRFYCICFAVLFILMELNMDQEKVHLKQLLIDTISLLCKNGLSYNRFLKIEGVIGITVDQTAFIVHIDQEMSEYNEEGESVRDVERVDLQLANLEDKDAKKDQAIEICEEAFDNHSESQKAGNSSFDMGNGVSENTIYESTQMPIKNCYTNTSQQPRKRPHRVNRPPPCGDYKPQLNESHWPEGSFQQHHGNMRFDENNITKWEPGEKLAGFFYDENSSGNNSLVQDIQNAKKFRSLSPKLRPFGCQYPDCGRTFIRKDHLVRHQRSYHGKQWGVDSQVVFHCNHCNRQFYKTFSLNRHMAEAHGIINQT